MAKAKVGEKNSGGRPVTPIDWDALDKLLEIQCTCREVAFFFDCSEDTIDRACKREKQIGFAEYSSQKREKGRISLRRRQVEVALTGNVAMLIWLGKQYLGQSEKLEQTQTLSEQKLIIRMEDDE